MNRHWSLLWELGWPYELFFKAVCDCSFYFICFGGLFPSKVKHARTIILFFSPFVQVNGQVILPNPYSIVYMLLLPVTAISLQMMMSRLQNAPGSLYNNQLVLHSPFFCNPSLVFNCLRTCSRAQHQHKETA